MGWPVPVLHDGLRSLGDGALGCAGSFVRAVAGAVHDDLVAGVDEPVEQGFGDDGVGEQGVPVGRAAVAGDDHGLAGPFGDQFVEVVGLGGGELAEAEVVADEDGRAGPGSEAFVPGGVGAAAGEVGEDAAGLGEADFVAGADGLVAEGAGDEGLADADWAGQDD